ncbi:hypothetical protein EB241_00235 [Erwinia psidii]|uniref:Uncharacterized protein n=1 Tax=Erwinia psidii TaxID=69224 RepID=A0A3N6S2I9_9GAMM|nr:hypothetical protein EB241_00235 [Erwinia psidii]
MSRFSEKISVDWLHTDSNIRTAGQLLNPVYRARSMPKWLAAHQSRSAQSPEQKSHVSKINATNVVGFIHKRRHQR